MIVSLGAWAPVAMKNMWLCHKLENFKELQNMISCLSWKQGAHENSLPFLGTHQQLCKFSWGQQTLTLHKSHHLSPLSKACTYREGNVGLSRRAL
jgi:hypothetical protein